LSGAFLDSALLAMTFLYHSNTIYFRITDLFTAQPSESTQFRTEGAQAVGPEADFSRRFNISLKHEWSYASIPPNTFMECAKQNFP
jgi:hypothetical protein